MMELEAQIKAIGERIGRARTVVAFTGAGISTESGIADFRSPGGVWSRYQPVYFDEFMASAEARLRHWRMKREQYAEMGAARPNAGHAALAELEALGRLQGLVTQNIDGLHQEAGSRKVLELHGTNRFVACVVCGKRRPAHEILKRFDDPDVVPTCDACDGRLKPATVSFGQQLPADVVEESLRLSCESDVYLAIGSSLVVEPAASLPVHAKRSGAFLVVINRDQTPVDPIADAVIREPIGRVLRSIVDSLPGGD